jgi:hypothetical protein
MNSSAISSTQRLETSNQLEERKSRSNHFSKLAD